MKAPEPLHTCRTWTYAELCDRSRAPRELVNAVGPVLTTNDNTPGANRP